MPEPSRRMQVAAAGVRTLLTGAYPSEQLIWVRESVCSGWFGSDGRNCAALTERKMAELERLLPAYKVRCGDGPDGSSPDLGPFPPRVSVSALTDADASGGSVRVLAVAGGLDCAGSEYDVTLLPHAPPRAVESGATAIC